MNYVRSSLQYAVFPVAASFCLSFLDLVNNFALMIGKPITVQYTDQCPYYKPILSPHMFTVQSFRSYEFIFYDEHICLKLLFIIRYFAYGTPFPRSPVLSSALLPNDKYSSFLLVTFPA